ncbi:MAG TPA: hypothetical protein VLL54_09610 [Pyrinomonadaceae bacterium]|nr:hypothetical protein [Pyrinomonadaceae bacterium]
MKKFALIICFALLLYLTYSSATTGYAALLTEKALAARDLDRASNAVRLSPDNPRPRVVLGALLEASEERPTAIQLYQTAVALRPDDYLLRLQLARALELEGDSKAAIDSASIAVVLAPSYAQAHWQLGNILIRAGRSEAGFSELRFAATSDPTLLPGIIDLAWQLSEGHHEFIGRAIDPQTPQAYRALFLDFKKRGLTREANRWLKLGGDALRDERRAYLSELIGAEKFTEAYEVWAIEHPSDPDGEILPNGSFENQTDLSEPGFSWRVSNPDKSVVLSLDNELPKQGHSSLRFDFNGATPAADLISRLLLLQSKSHYKLHFSFRADNLVSGGLPYLVVIDAMTDKPLGLTEVFQPTTDGWRDGVIEFTTGESTDANAAIRIALQRQACPAPQCPIFGKLWLDDFFLQGPGQYIQRVR